MTGLMMLAVGAMAAGLPDIDSPLKTGQKAANDWALVIGMPPLLHRVRTSLRGI